MCSVAKSGLLLSDTDWVTSMDWRKADRKLPRIDRLRSLNRFGICKLLRVISAFSTCPKQTAEGHFQTRVIPDWKLHDELIYRYRPSSGRPLVPIFSRSKVFPDCRFGSHFPQCSKIWGAEGDNSQTLRRIVNSEMAHSHANPHRLCHYALSVRPVRYQRIQIRSTDSK